MRKRRVAEIAMHMCAAACIVLGFLVLGLGAKPLEVPKTESPTVLVPLLAVGLASLALVSELVALALRTRRV